MPDYSVHADFLARLQAATSEEEKSWMLMEFSLNLLSPTVSEAVWVAAIPHKFDKPFLIALLEKDLTDDDWENLLSQSYIEHLWDGGYAVHESTRKLLLDKLYQHNPQQYRELNRRAAMYCEQQNQDELCWQVATLHHKALANLEGVEIDFNNQSTIWLNDSRYKIEALVRPMLEEVKALRVNKKVAATVLRWQGIIDSLRCNR